MSEWMWGFAAGVFSMALMGIINWLRLIGRRPVELSPDKPLWSEETQKMIDEAQKMGEEMMKSVEKMKEKK